MDAQESEAGRAIGTRWIPGLKLDVAETAMQYNIQQVDRRISAHNYRALWKAQDTLQRLGVIKSMFDVNKHIEPKYILNVMKTTRSCFPTCRLFLRRWRSGRATSSSPENVADPSAREA